MQQVVEREATRLEDKISAVLLKLTSQNQQLVSGGTGDQLLDLGPGITCVRYSESVVKDSCEESKSRKTMLVHPEVTSEQTKSRAGFNTT